ncbi:MAG: SufE family protein [Pikeienuella sp.]
MTTEAFEEIVETFEFLDDWEDRYRHVIDLGRAMPEMPESQKGPLTKVDGCASQVWIAPSIEGAGADARLHFAGDSDAMIVRGLIAVLHALMSGQSPEAILKTDALAEMSRLGLDQHLSAQRSNGLRAMIVRITELAKAAV